MIVLLCIALAILAPSALQAKEPGIYGVNVVWGVSGGGSDWKRNDTHLKLAALLKEAGAQNIRIGIGWYDTEPQRGHYDFRDTDEFVNFGSKLGVELVCCLATVPTWASGVDGSPDEKLIREKTGNLIGVLPPEDKYLPDMERWASEVAKRYKGKIRFYEIGNELDGSGGPIIMRNEHGGLVDIRCCGDPAVYTKMLKACFAGIKRVDPQAKVAVCGLQGEENTYFLQQIYANGGRAYFDAVAVHPYSTREEGIKWEWLDQTYELLKMMGDGNKKLWLTEWGWGVNINSPDELKAQSDSIERTLAEMAKRPYIAQASLHTLNDWRGNEANPDSLSSMGLVTYDLKPKVPFYGFKRAAHGESTAKSIFEGRTPEHKAYPPGSSEPTACPRLVQPPKIDGKLSDWPEGSIIASTEKYKAYAGWDDSDFYFACRVTDSTPIPASVEEWMWKADSVQIAFDPLRETRRWPGFGYDDTEYGFARTSTGNDIGWRCHGTVNLPAGRVYSERDKPSAYRVQVYRDEDAWVYEAAIPWSGIVPKGTEVPRDVGFSIAINDAAPGRERQAVEWGGGIVSEKDPGKFRTLKLVR